jgi:ABC-2 type transport system ATP-binding protein
MNTIIEVSGLSKRFGRKKAVDNIDFVVNKGEIFGLLGPNGSGKTTTLSIILTLLKPDAGKISLFGSHDLTRALKRIGVLLESTSYYPELSAVSNLKISCKIKNVDESKIDEVLERTGLINDRKVKVKSFSLGMKQRLSIASVLLSDPELLIFDEPTNGLDPLGIAEMRQLILNLAKEDKTILVASHLLNEMEKVCTHIAIMKYGNILRKGEMKSLMNGYATLEEFFLTITK